MPLFFFLPFWCLFCRVLTALQGPVVYDWCSQIMQAWGALAVWYKSYFDLLGSRTVLGWSCPFLFFCFHSLLAWSLVPSLSLAIFPCFLLYLNPSIIDCNKLVLMGGGLCMLVTEIRMAYSWSRLISCGGMVVACWIPIISPHQNSTARLMWPRNMRRDCSWFPCYTFLSTFDDFNDKQFDELSERR